MTPRYFLIDGDGRGSERSHVYDREDGGHGKKDKWCKSLCGQRVASPRGARKLRHYAYDCERCRKILLNRADAGTQS